MTLSGFSSATENGDSDWTCKLDQDCLNEFHTVLLSKEDERGIYKSCQTIYDDNKLCCSDFSQCRESWDEGPTQDLANSLSGLSPEALSSCELSQLSPLLSVLSGVQDNFCVLGVKNCKEVCKTKLEEVKQSFRRCFSVPANTPIDEMVKKVSTSSAPEGQEICYQELKKIADKYKEQSLEKTSLLREDLEAKDLVKCEEIKTAQSQQSIGALTVTMCNNAKAQRQKEEQEAQAKQKKIEKQKELERKKALERKKRLEEQAKRRKAEQRIRAAEQRRRAEQRKKAQAQAKAPPRRQPPPPTRPATRNKAPVPPKKPATNPASAPQSTKKVANKTLKTSPENSETSFSSQTKSTSTNSLTEGELNAIQLAQADIPSGSCPVSMPEIKSTVVFQSVEAPQIEPMDEQAHPPYDNYDLVWNKPAGVLVELDQANMDKETEFHLVISIEGTTYFIDKCFHEPFEEIMIASSEKYCDFKQSDFKEKDFYKFFPLPMSANFLRDKKNIRVAFELSPKGYIENHACVKKSGFNFNIIETGDLSLTWARLKPYEKNCPYKATPFSKVEEFANSDEVLKRIPSMFPTTGVISRVFRFKKDRADYIQGYCNNNLAVDHPGVQETQGLLSDIDWLEQLRAHNGYDKIFAVVPGDYFLFHNIYYKNRDDPNDDTKYPPAGMMLPPLWDPAIDPELAETTDIHIEGINYGGSWNVAFVHSDEIDTGTVSHELGHTLGQGRDLYKEEELCRHFYLDEPNSCFRNRFIPQFLHTGREDNKPFWELSDRKKYSIMGGQSGIKKQWIDRETYQKILSAIVSNLGFVVHPWKNLFKKSSSLAILKRRSPTLKVIISGFYYEEDKRAFINPRIRLYKTRLSTKSFYPLTENTMIPVVIFQLKEGDRVLEEIKRLILKSEMELLYKNKHPIKKPFPFSHAMAVFELPTDYRDRDLRIVVLDSRKKPIYSTSVPKRTKKSPISKK